MVVVGLEMPITHIVWLWMFWIICIKMKWWVVMSKFKFKKGKEYNLNQIKYVVDGTGKLEPFDFRLIDKMKLDLI